jgi:hypothetical protein
MAGDQQKRVSIVVPFYNEEDGVDVFYATLTRHLREVPSTKTTSASSIDSCLLR